MKEESSDPGRLRSRRGLLAGIGILSIFAFLRIPSFRKKPQEIACAPPNQAEKKTLLTEDGQLVEVDMSKIKLLQQKISDKELQQWIKRK
jgi:hypothetical protein